MNTPYYRDGHVTLYHGDMREILPNQIEVDLIVADPPYGETTLVWDQWPPGWPAVAAGAAPSMWCFGSFRMFQERRDEFTAWTYSHEVIWEKHNGSGFTADRFRRVHELAVHWYRGQWRNIHHQVPLEPAGRKGGGERRGGRDGLAHTGDIGQTEPAHLTRLARSVIRSRSLNGRALHPTEKPISVLTALIEYGCPPGGTVLDPFAGSGSTLDAARQAGRHAIGIEADERYCETIARRLTQDFLDFGAAS